MNEKVIKIMFEFERMRHKVGFTSVRSHDHKTVDNSDANYEPDGLTTADLRLVIQHDRYIDPTSCTVHTARTKPVS